MRRAAADGAAEPPNRPQRGDAGSVAARLAAARLRLALERPFLGALAAYLPVEESRVCRSFDTDGRRIAVNPAAVADWSEAAFAWMLAHLTLHCALGHVHRRGGRDRVRWHVACDHATNLLLLEDGLAPPNLGRAGAAARPSCDTRFRGWSAEAIYAVLESDCPPGETASALGETGSASGETPMEHSLAEAWEADPGDRGGARLGSGEADPGDRGGARLGSGEAVRDQLARRWRERVAAVAASLHASRRLPSTWRTVAGIEPAERLPWRTVLARFMAGVAQDDFSYARPSRREGEVILPGRAGPAAELVAAIDTSGSIGASEQQQFLDELRALKSQVRARLAVLACDHQLGAGSPWRFEPHEPIELPHPLEGGGGTRFTPVFDWVNSQGHAPHALVYLTDGVGEFPVAAPGYPVLWIVKGRAPVPWGERIGFD